MSLVHGGAETCVAVAVFEAEELAPEVVVDGTDGLGGAVEPDAVEGLGVLDVLRAPDPEVELPHPASAAPVMSTNAASRALLRIIGRPLLGILSTSFTSFHRSAATVQVSSAVDPH